MDLWRQLRIRETELPADWVTLIAAARHLQDAADATTAVVLDTLGPDVPYQRVLSRQQALNNKYARIAGRNLIVAPYRIRRNRLPGGGYEIVAARDLTDKIEEVMVIWPDQ